MSKELIERLRKVAARVADIARNWEGDDDDDLLAHALELREIADTLSLSGAAPTASPATQPGDVSIDHHAYRVAHIPEPTPPARLTSQDAMAKALEEIADLASTEGSDPDYMLMLILGRAEAALAASRRSKEPT